MKKRIFALVICTLLILAFSVPAFALVYDDTLPRIVDDADIFTDSEESLLNDYVAKCREEYETDVVIAAVTTMNGQNIDDFAMDYFDYGGQNSGSGHSYGIGDNYDGVILIICMEPGNHMYGISTTGKEIQNFTDRYIEFMYDVIGGYLGDGDFYGGANKFIEMSEDAFKGDAKYDSYYDKNNYNSDGDYSYSGTERSKSKTRYDVDTALKSFGGSLVAGLIIALVIAGSLKNQMKPVKLATSAKNYLVANSLNIFYCNEMFIRSDVTKTAKPKNNSSGGSSHSGSSGRSHGGGGGRSF